jgi:hypothetical protein
MVQLTYYPPAAQQDDQQPAAQVNDALRWGYTFTDLDRLTRMALSRHHYGRGITSAADRYHAAWGGIAIALYEATEHSDRADLIHAGWEAITAMNNAETKAHGWVHEKGETRHRPAVAIYWHTPGEGWEEALVERIAIHQVLEYLTPAPRDAVNAVAAAWGDYAAAERMLGVTRATLTERLRVARNTALQLLMEGETPPKTFVRSRDPIKHGTPHGARAHSKRREKPCEECRLAVQQGEAA